MENPENRAAVKVEHNGSWAELTLKKADTPAEVALAALVAAHGNTAQMILQLPVPLCGARTKLVDQLGKITATLISVVGVAEPTPPVADGMFHHTVTERFPTAEEMPA